MREPDRERLPDRLRDLDLEVDRDFEVRERDPDRDLERLLLPECDLGRDVERLDLSVKIRNCIVDSQRLVSFYYYLLL